MTDHDTLLERELRDTFHTMADTFQPSPMPRDLWDRGRARPAIRVRPELVAAVVVLIALLISVVGLARPAALLQPADVPDGGALPAEVWLPSADDVRAEAAGYLGDVGPASVAVMLDDTIALLVEAESGKHHVREIEAVGPGELLPSLELSPDGTRLAHSFRPIENEFFRGLAIASLVDGGSVGLELRNPDRQPIAVRQIQWSPDGTWLAWTGSALDPGEGWVDEASWVGVLDAEADRARQWQLPAGTQSEPSVAVTDDGAVAVATDARLWLIDDTAPGGQLEQRDAQRLPEDVNPTMGAMAFDRSGTILSVEMEPEVDTLTSHDLDLSQETVSASVREWKYSPERNPWGVSILGRTPDGALLGLDGVMLEAGDRSDPYVQRSTDDGTAEELIRIHGSDGTGLTHLPLSVATDLGDGEPVAFARPSWAVDRTPWLVAVVVLSLLLAALGGLLWRRNRAATRDEPLVETPRDTPSWRGWATAVALAGAVVAVLVLVAVFLTGASLAFAPGWIPALGALGVVAVAVGLHRWRTGRSPFGGYGLALVLLLALLYSAVPIWPTLGLPVTDGPALPQTAYAPNPDADLDQADSVLDLDVSRASVVLGQSPEGVHSEEVVLVDAQDGRHHRARLPGHHAFVGEYFEGPLTLSADGRHLAWGYADFDKDEAGIALLDLGDDEVRRLPLVGRQDKPVRVTQLSWSPDGSHLAWLGDEVAQWRDATSTFVGPIRTLGATPTERLSASFRSYRGGYENPGVVAVGNDGRTHALLGTKLLSFDAEAPSDVQTRVVGERALPWSSALVDEEGSTLTVGLNGQIVDSMAAGLRTLDLSDPDSQLVTSPWGITQDGDRVDVLGHTPAGSTVALRTPAQRSYDGTKVLVLEADAESGWPVTEVDERWTGEMLSVATDLADLPPLTNNQPYWTVSQVRWILTGFFAAMLAIQVVSVLVRHRRLRAGNRTVPARV